MKPMVLASYSLLLAAAIGCSNKEPAATSQPVASPAAAAASPAAPAVPKGPAAIATAEGKKAGLRVEVTELKRSGGGTVNLKFAVINESEASLEVSDVMELLDVMKNSEYTIGGAHLIDPVGKKKYFVARDGENKCVCSQFAAITKGSRVNHWAKFAAPPDDVERISVVIPSFSPMDDVPLSR